MKILLNRRLRESGLGILGVIIFVALLIIVVAVMVILLIRVAKKLVDRPAQTSIDGALVMEDGMSSSETYTYTGDWTTNDTASTTSAGVIEPPTAMIMKVETESGTYPAIGYDFSTSKDGVYDVIVEKSSTPFAGTTNWSSLWTNRIDTTVFDLDTTNDIQLYIDFNAGGASFYRINVIPVPP
jgi:hypothetical protein